MEKDNWCSECGAMVAAHAPEGLCPRCLLKQGVGDTPVADVDGDPDAAGVIIKTVEETGGRYTHLGEFAKGGMGRVLIVHDEHLERDVALKELLLGKVESSGGQATPVSGSIEVVGRFLREARITGRLEHPSITPVYELGRRKDGTLYYTMKLVRGQTLQKAIRDAGSLEERLRLLPHFVDLCQAIAYAHSRGVIHRDIKPANVMVGEFGETVVIDWGLAKAQGQRDVAREALSAAPDAVTTFDFTNEDGESQIVRTKYGQTMGTPVYMSPEQAKGDLDIIDERSDVYSLGAVLYELLTGKTPFAGLSLEGVIYHAIHEKPEPVESVEPGCPPELIAICNRAMEKAPDRRYPSAKSLADELERFLSGALVQSYQYRNTELLRRFLRRHKTAVAMATLCLLAVTTLSAVYMLVLRHKNDLLENSLYQANIFRAQSQIEHGQVANAVDTLGSTPERLRNWEWGHLQYECRHNVWATLKGHRYGVYCVAFSPDGRRVLTGSGDGTAKLWDAESGKQLLTLDCNGGYGVNSVAFSPDGRRLLTGEGLKTARLWDAESGKELLTLTDHTADVRSVAFSPDGRRVLTGYDGKNAAKLWDAESGKELLTLAGHTGTVWSVAFSPDGRRALTGSGDKTAKLWDADSGKELLTLAGHASGIVSVAFSPDGRRVLTGSHDKTAKVWDTDSGKELFTLTGHKSYLLSVAFSPDGRQLLTGSGDCKAKLWDAESGKELLTLAGHASAVGSVAFSPDGRRILTGSGDDTAKLWDIKSDKESLTLAGHASYVLSVAFSLDGRRILTGSGDLSGSGDNTAKLWDVESGKELRTLAGHTNGVVSVAFSSDGRRVLTGSGDDTAKLWDAETGKELLTLTGHTANVSSVAFSPDGRRLLTGSGNSGRAKLWDADSGKELLTVVGNVQSVAFSPDGQRVLMGSWDRAKLWDADSGKELLTLEAGKWGNTVESVAFSLDGRRVLTGFDDGTAKLWNANSGKQLLTLTGHASRVNSVAFSPDGQRVLTGSADCTAKLWDADSGKELLTLTEHTGAVTSVAFSPDGQRVLTGSADNTAKLWNAMPWTTDALPGDSTMPLDARLEQWNRERIINAGK